MKKRILFLFISFCPLMLMAANPGFGTRKYEVTGMVEYNYNKTYRHQANFDIQALMPINQHFEMEAKVQLSTANVYTGALQFRPKFELPAGELFLESNLMYRAIVRNQVADITAAVGVGYRMDYVSVTIGSFCRVIDDWNRSWFSNETYIVEPFNFFYRVEAFCRPQDNNWNLSFMISNIDDYQMERMWQPAFSIGAWYDVTDHWRVCLAAQCKPSGMFHLNVTFYSAYLRAGFNYRF